MKQFNVLLILIMGFILFIGCSEEVPAQPYNNYELYSNPVPGATKYHWFLEKKSANPYSFSQGMDYLDRNGNGIAEVGDTVRSVGTTTVPLFTTQRLLNDGSEYRIGVVAEDAAGFYGGIGTIIGNVGTVPGIPTPGFRKK